MSDPKKPILDYRTPEPIDPDEVQLTPRVLALLSVVINLLSLAGLALVIATWGNFWIEPMLAHRVLGLSFVGCMLALWTFRWRDRNARKIAKRSLLLGIFPLLVTLIYTIAPPRMNGFGGFM